MQNTTQQSLIQIGTRVFTSLYDLGAGTVYAIHGDQSAETVRHFGIIGSGGSAEFDIVFDCGARSDRLSECTLRGVQWDILDEHVSPEFIAAALANAVTFTASKVAQEKEAKDAFNLAVEQLKVAPEYSHLKQQDNQIHSSKLAVMNIRAELKKTFKGIKFSVRSDFNSVSIRWTDGVICQQVEELVDRFSSGKFNGMEDIFEYEKTPWTTVFGGIKYISCSREKSSELVQRAIDALFHEFPGNFTGIDKPSAEDFKQGSTFHIRVPGFDESLQTVIHRKLNTTV